MAEKKMSLTYSELKDLLEGKGSKEILEKMELAETAETNKAARQVAKDTITEKCLAFIDTELAPLNIPAGIMGISMTFPYIPGDNSFIATETGLKVDFGNQLKVSDEVLNIIGQAEIVKKGKNNAPAAFLKKCLGDSRYAYIISKIAFDRGLGTTLSDLYSSETAASFNVDGIPEGDQAKVFIKYSKDVEGINPTGFSTVSGNWFTIITVGKSVSSGNGGKRRPRTAKPDNYKNWQAKVNECPEQHLVEARKWLKEKYPPDWGKHISAPKVLIKFEDAEFIQKRAEADARADA